MVDVDLAETKRVQLEMESFDVVKPGRLESEICDFKIVKHYNHNQSTTISIYREQIPDLIRLLEAARDGRM